MSLRLILAVLIAVVSLSLPAETKKTGRKLPTLVWEFNPPNITSPKSVKDTIVEAEPPRFYFKDYSKAAGLAEIMSWQAEFWNLPVSIQRIEHLEGLYTKWFDDAIERIRQEPQNVYTMAWQQARIQSLQSAKQATLWTLQTSKQEYIRQCQLFWNSP